MLLWGSFTFFLGCCCCSLRPPHGRDTVGGMVWALGWFFGRKKERLWFTWLSVVFWKRVEKNAPPPEGWWATVGGGFLGGGTLARVVPPPTSCAPSGTLFHSLSAPKNYPRPSKQPTLLFSTKKSPTGGGGSVLGLNNLVRLK